MPAWLSTLVQRFRTTPVLVPVPVVAQEPARQKRTKPKREGPKGFQAKMYGVRPKSAAELAWGEEPAARILPPGPTISEHVANDAKVVDPYEQKALHVEYLRIRSTSKAECDICAACFFENPNHIVKTKKDNLERHFGRKHHEGGAWRRCTVCTAVFFTQQLKRHAEYCHPDSAVKQNPGI